jgi:hypothetical protein
MSAERRAMQHADGSAVFAGRSGTRLHFRMDGPYVPKLIVVHAPAFRTEAEIGLVKECNEQKQPKRSK